MRSSRDIGCGTQRAVVLPALGCRAWSERGARVAGQDDASLPSARCVTFHLRRLDFRGAALLTHAETDTRWLLVLYAVGIVELELENTSAFMLLLFVIPLAFTLSGFLLWILYALNGR